MELSEKEIEQNRQDILLLQRLLNGVNYSNLGQICKLREKLEERNPFQTQIGEHYYQKIKQISELKNDGKCIFCGKKFGPATVVCNECRHKINKLAQVADESQDSGYDKAKISKKAKGILS